MHRRVDRGIHRGQIVPVELGHDVEPGIRQQESPAVEHAVVLHVGAHARKARADGGVMTAPVLQARVGGHVLPARRQKDPRDHVAGGRGGLTWMGRPRLTSAASISASANVGWAWTVSARSSAVAPISMASAISAISSVERGPAR